MRKMLVFVLRLSMTLLPLVPLVVVAQSQSASEEHVMPDSTRLNGLAHKLLEQSLTSNALTGPDVKPWHLKVDFQVLPSPNTTRPVNGSMEEWYAGPYRWRRTYTSSEPRWSGSEWSVSSTERYSKKQKHEEFEDYWVTLRVARPVVDPLYQVANVKATDQLDVRRVNTAGITLNCISLTDVSAAEHGRKPEWFIPTMCFDKDLHLRLVQSEETVVQFEDIQPFEGRSVARDVKIIFGGRLMAEMKVTQLEAVDHIEETLLKPPADASLRPYVIEPGYPRPVSIYEVGAHVPPLPDGRRFQGRLLVPVIIHKDGTVKLQHSASSSPMQAIFDAVYTAVAKWKFQPYQVDGQPVEAAYDVPYEISDKPFVPSYEQGSVPPVDGVAGPHVSK